jgi:hypothetical protein
MTSHIDYHSILVSKCPNICNKNPIINKIVPICARQFSNSDALSHVHFHMT